MVVAVFTGHPERDALAERVCRLAAGGAQVIAVGMNTPRCLAGLPESVWQIMAWQYDELAVRAVIRMLREGALKG